MTVSELLQSAVAQLLDAGIEDGESVSESLLAHVLAIDPMELLSRGEDVLNDSQVKRFNGFIEKAAEHYPPQYLTGSVSFFGHSFISDPRALIPRPDTETLVRAVLERCEDDMLRVLDFGTGTGCIAVSLKLARPGWMVSGADRSEDALSLAEANLKRHELARSINLFRVSSLRGAADSEWDVIVSNPPYVSLSEYEGLSRRVKDYEPETALVSGDDGLELIRHLVEEAVRVVRHKGLLFIEIGHQQGGAVRRLFEQSGYDQIEVLHDPSGLERVVVGRNAGLPVDPNDEVLELGFDG